MGQAADTDILALVEIERNSRHKFEFFMGPVGVDQPISAKTAYAFVQAGGKIYHGLSVFEAKMRHANQVSGIPCFFLGPDCIAVARCQSFAGSIFLPENSR